MSADVMPWGFRHWSFSSVDGYIRSPAYWVLSRICKYQFPSDPKRERGTAIETAVSRHLIQGISLDETTKYALELYDQATADLDVDEAAEARVAIEPLVALILPEVAQLGPLVSFQKRHEIRLPGVRLPFVGNTDFEFENILVDMKITARTPPALTAAHTRQGGLYHVMTGKPVRFLYGVALKTPKLVTHDLGDHVMGVEQLRQCAIRIERMLEFCKTEKEFADMIMPDLENFTWADPLVRAARQEVWGF